MVFEVERPDCSVPAPQQQQQQHDDGGGGGGDDDDDAPRRIKQRKWAVSRTKVCTQRKSRRGRTQIKFWRGLTCCTHHIPGERATRAHETSANVRSLHIGCARMQPDGQHDLAATVSHNHAGARACSQTAGTTTRRAHRMQPDGRHDHSRVIKAHNHAAIICAGQQTKKRKRYHAPSGSFRRRLENFQRTTSLPQM